MKIGKAIGVGMQAEVFRVKLIFVLRDLLGENFNNSWREKIRQQLLQVIWNSVCNIENIDKLYEKYENR